MITTCRRSCCWSVFGRCLKGRNCPCHPKKGTK